MTPQTLRALTQKLWEDASRRENLFRNSVLFSLLFHFGFFGFLHFRNLFPSAGSERIEIDLTKPFRIGGNPLLKPGGGTTLKEVKDPSPPAPMEETLTEKKMPPKDWVIPGPNTKVIEKPQPEGVPAENRSPHGIEGGTGEGYTGTGGGLGGGDGEGGGLKLDRYPKLKNLKEIRKLMLRNYPSAEREAGIQSRVYMNVHIDDKGNVVGMDIVGSGGVNFDAAAKVIAPRMRFEPAVVEGAPKGVKIRQSLVFTLADEE